MLKKFWVKFTSFWAKENTKCLNVLWNCLWNKQFISQISKIKTLTQSIKKKHDKVQTCKFCR